MNTTITEESTTGERENMNCAADTNREDIYAMLCALKKDYLAFLQLLREKRPELYREITNC